MASEPVRGGFHTVTPYLIVEDLDACIEFIKAAFDGKEINRMPGAAGGMHVEMRIGDSMVMIGSGPSAEPIPAMLYLYMHNVDGVYQQALAAGATSMMEPVNQPDGERRAGVKDVGGNLWYIGAPLETGS